MTSSGQAPPAVQTILGIRFFVGSAKEAVDYLTRAGGYVVVPAAPGLIKLTQDEEYQKAVTEADMAIADSGFMVLLWRMLERSPIPRISGLTYLRQLLEEAELRKAGQTFWVTPSQAAEEKTRTWLESRGFELRNDTYIAPLYPTVVEDPELVRLLETKRPKHVIIGIGGGTQEKLGHYLRLNLSYRPAIHCIGAAIGFLTGDQVKVPCWADRLYVGWLLRTLWQPRLYFPRYWEARTLAWLVWKYRDRLPPFEKD